jgi:hypothetical protein
VSAAAGGFVSDSLQTVESGVFDPLKRHARQYKSIYRNAKPPRTDWGFGFLGLKTWRSWQLGGEKMIRPR